MSVHLTCEETPLAWPESVSLSDLSVNGKPDKECGIILKSPTPGSLQILTRRAGSGVGDGVNIQESVGLSADYRGQRYALEEAIFHAQGLHVFPGRKEKYPAEYHIYMRTTREPIRYITVVFPVSHHETHGRGADYFAATTSRPDASPKPTFETLLSASDFVQYQGPDLRGRTKANRTTPACTSKDERQYLLILNVLQIRAKDLNRIYSEGSLSTDARDWPAPGAEALTQVPRDRLIRAAVHASPGILMDDKRKPEAKPPVKPQVKEGFVGEAKEQTFKPIKVVDGRPTLDMSGTSVDVRTIFGLDSDVTPVDASALKTLDTVIVGTSVISAVLGIAFADYVVLPFFWGLFFTGQEGPVGLLMRPWMVLLPQLLLYFFVVWGVVVLSPILLWIFAPAIYRLFGLK